MAETIFIIIFLAIIFKFRKYIWMPTILIVAAYCKWKLIDPIVLQFQLWRYKPRQEIDPSIFTNHTIKLFKTNNLFLRNLSEDR